MSRDALNKDYIKPQKSVGIVVHNTQISRSMYSEACANRNALDPLADGEHRHDIGKAMRGDPVWNWHDSSGIIDYEECDPMHPHRDNTTINAMVVANGAGTRGSDTPDTIEKRVRILGVVEVDKPEGKTKFTTVVGGIMTVRNNGPNKIHTNDIVIVRYPTKEQRQSAAHTRAEKAGVVKFQLQRYQPEMHRNQVKCIYECLMDTTNKFNYLPAYKRYCQQTVDSHIGTTIVMLGANFNATRQILNSAPTAEVGLTKLAEHLGHREFGGKPNNDMLHKLFAPYSQSNGAKNAALFNGAAPNDVQAKLNKMQREAMGDALYNLAQLVDSLNNLIIGEAKSPANSGEDFSLQIKSYTH